MDPAVWCPNMADQSLNARIALNMREMLMQREARGH